MRFNVASLLVLLAVVLGMAAARTPLVGGASDVRGPDSVIQDVVASVSPAILATTGSLGVAPGAPLSVVEYRTQVVAGTNFFVKIKAENSPTEYIACRLFRPLPPNHKDIEVVRCEASSATAELKYF